jgi:hypothetical protein
MILMVLSFHEGFMHYDKSYSTRAATVFGLVSGSLFLFYGLVGGFSSFDLIYIQSTRSVAYVQDAYLPLVLIANRTLAAAITVSGFWFSRVNLQLLREQSLPPLLAYLGIGAGGIALFGFVLPGGGFSMLSLLLSSVWRIFYGLNLR